MSTANAFQVQKRSQQAIIEYSRQCYNLLNQQWNIREQMRQTDLNYMRENDFTTEQFKAKTANVYGDPTKFQNVTVPVIFPQVRAAVTYQASVFLTGSPIFGVVSSPQYQDQAMQMQAVIEENSIRGAWTREFLILFNDLFKYNLGFIECNWAREVTPAIETDIGFSASQGKPKDVMWQGNKLKRIDPYNCFFDTRYKPTEIPTRGEFIGYTELFSRTELKSFINQLPDKMVQNITPAFESGLGGVGYGSGGIESYYVPWINPNALIQQDPRRTFDWMAWASLAGSDPRINYQNLYEITTLYARIIPEDFAINVPSRATPQIWKFIIVNHSVLIYAERQTNAHNKLPILVGQALEDGLGYQTKSHALNAAPFQSVASALVNSAIAARRRSISDRGLYDPSRVAHHHINSDSPVAKIPVRPSAYGKPVQEAYYPIPYEDRNSQAAFQEVGQILQFANIVGGQNPARQGQFVKGNKTTTEFDTVMNNANGPDQMTALLLEGQIFTPLKEMLKINTLQFQAGTTVYSPSQEKNIQIDPIALRQAIFEFKMTDGLTPADKLISGEMLGMAFQTISAPNSPVGQAYNAGPLFSYLMKTRNVDLQPFEKSPEQMAYEQAVEIWSQTVQAITQQVLKAGGDPSKMQLPPQPTPEAYGYQPQGLNPNPQTPPAAANGPNASS